MHHLLIDVAHLAVTPFAGHPLAVGHHRFGVGGDPLAVKRGLISGAGEVRLALAGEQPSPRVFCTLKGAPFFELMRIKHEKIGTISGG